MNTKLLSGLVAILLANLAHAAPLGAPVAPRPRPPAVPAAPTTQSAVSPCNPQASADYVPGVNAKGRPVAPADLPSSTDVQISTEVYAETHTANPNVPSVGVIVNLPGLAAPACAPAPTTTVRK